MRSFLFIAVSELFATLFRRRPPPTALPPDEVTPSSSSPPSSPQSSSVSSRSAPQQLFPTPAAQVSNPSAKVVPTNLVREGAHYERQTRDEKEPRIESKVAELLRGFCFRQTVVIGHLPTPLPRGKVFSISPRANVPPRCLHVCCEPHSEEWPVALALIGFDWRETTVWLLRMESASDSVVLQQLKAVDMMSAPCSVVVLLCSLPNIADIADSAGFIVDAAQNERPLLLLRKQQRHGRCFETHTPNVTPPCTPPLEPESEGFLVRFELSVNTLPEEVRRELPRGCAKVVGNLRELGEWNIDHGIRLVIAEDVLLGEVRVGKGEAEYKYVYVNGEGNVSWEVGENRRLSTSEDTLLRLEEHWRH